MSRLFLSFGCLMPAVLTVLLPRVVLLNGFRAQEGTHCETNT
jgi:hypothetical protein